MASSPPIVSVRQPRWWLAQRQVRSNPKARFASVAEHYAPLLAQASSGTEHQQLLQALVTDAWLAGVFGAAKLSSVISDALTADQTLGAPDDWAPGWAETASLPDSIPDALQALLDSTSNATMPDDSDAADAQADTASAYAADDGAQEAYSVAGIDQWNSVPDADACQNCLDAADAGPYDTGDDGPPWHNGCGCESEPVVTVAG